MQSAVSSYRGRFAPSPTGPLHFGSLVAAIGSFADAKYNQGEWIIRIEDLDPPRTVPGSITEILTALEKLGMEWDGEIIYQSQRSAFYQEVLEQLIHEKMVYPCTCSRKEIADSNMAEGGGIVYPGNCRNGITHLNRTPAFRLKTDNFPVRFNDVLQGVVSQQLDREIGDFVLKRADAVYAYQLAVVVDDAEQQITHVVRGADLLDSTPRQIYLQRLLGYTTPVYMHLPIVNNAQGEKLSKQTNAAAIDVSNVVPQMVAALGFLGQNPPNDLVNTDLAGFWQWTINNWRIDKIPLTGSFMR